MSIDLSQFHQVFFEESIEGLDVMESALMELDPEAVDSEVINTIFRAAHSIKGGSATFGFKSVSDFTHDMETILDQVRDGRRSINNDEINLFLQSVDCIREMIGLLQAGEDGFTTSSEELKAQFAAMLQVTGVSAKAGHAETEKEDAKTDGRLCRIRFIPGRDMLLTGNDAIRILKELEDYGRVENVFCHQDLPGFSELHPEKCYLSWDIDIHSSESKQDILSSFEWVEDESKIVFEEENLVSESTQWRIYFSPGENTLQTGNEPSRLFCALAEMGDLQVSCISDVLPKFSELTPEKVYLSWELELKGENISREDIYEIFEWVADESRLDIEDKSKRDEQKGKSAVQSDKQAEKAVGKPESGNAAPTKVKSAPSSSKSTNESGSIRVGIDKVDNLINMVGELVITQSMLGQLGTDFEVSQLPKLIEGLSQLEQNTRELQESVMRIRMLPISFTFSRFPRMVRDLGQKLEKKVHLEMLGEQTELDKTVMEKIGDPLVHLVRNAVDHGIEVPAERLKKGKPETGNVTLNAYHQSGNVVIEIKDDGKGLDRDLLANKAVDKALMSKQEADALSDEQVFDLIFHPGFSTAKEISDVSGRGVGMDVVKKNIQALNGNVELKSEKDVGSTITIRLPLTLAILDGQLVRVGKNIFIFPLVSIVESMQYEEERINDIAGGCNVFRLRDDYVPVVELHQAFNIRADSNDLDSALMVVVESDGEKIGIVVDELLAQQQVVIKSLEQNYKRVDGVSGATILGDGTVALILDIPGIVKLSGAKFKESQLHIASQRHAEMTNQHTAV